MCFNPIDDANYVKGPAFLNTKQNSVELTLLFGNTLTLAPLALDYSKS